MVLQTIKYWGTGKNRYQMELPSSAAKHVPGDYEVRDAGAGPRRGGGAQRGGHGAGGGHSEGGTAVLRGRLSRRLRDFHLTFDLLEKDRC